LVSVSSGLFPFFSLFHLLLTCLSSAPPGCNFLSVVPSWTSQLGW
jgi:hypothetical protein